MAWRIDEPLVRAELDNRTKGRVTGMLWFAGRDRPVTLKLEGNPWRDLAGHRVLITNPAPKTADLSRFADLQAGVVGDITASRKVKMPDGPMEEFLAGYKSGKTFTFHWANSLYLEWFSESNGRVVIESADYRIELDGPPSWQMTESEEDAQRKANQEAITRFMERLVGAAGPAPAGNEEEADRPTSRTEAEADAEAARMDLLMDRVQARLEREGRAEADFERIMDEERSRLRRERGEPEPEPLTPEEEAERSAWVEEMNAAAEEALEEMKGEPVDLPDHPLVELCSELGVRLHHDAKNNRWIPEGASPEHPFYEIEHGVQFASAKLAGALNRSSREQEWPPDPLFAGDTLVRLKKARRYLKDALAGLDAADEQRLADMEWRSRTRREIGAILARVEQLIREVRSALE